MKFNKLLFMILSLVFTDFAFGMFEDIKQNDVRFFIKSKFHDYDPLFIPDSILTQLTEGTIIYEVHKSDSGKIKDIRIKESTYGNQEIENIFKDLISTWHYKPEKNSKPDYYYFNLVPDCRKYPSVKIRHGSDRWSIDDDFIYSNNFNKITPPFLIYKDKIKLPERYKHINKDSLYIDALIDKHGFIQDYKFCSCLNDSLSKKILSDVIYFRLWVIIPADNKANNNESDWLRINLKDTDIIYIKDEEYDYNTIRLIE